MHKVLLFYPSFESEGTEAPLYTDIPLSVAALAEAVGARFEVEVIDERLKDGSFQTGELAERLRDVFAVGISATTSAQITNGLRFARRVRDLAPEIRLIWGGWHPSLMPGETLMHTLVDIVVIGQGERILPRLLDRLKRGEEPFDMPGVAYKLPEGGIIIGKTEKTERMPIPKSMRGGYRYLRMPEYIHEGWGNRRILGYESSRGCPYACTFCSIGAVFKRRWQGLGCENVYRDLKYLKEQYDIDAVHFFDNNFFVDRERALKFSEMLRAGCLELRWDGASAVRQFLKFTHQELKALTDSGFYRVIAGVESGDADVLRHLNKRHTNGEVLELVRRCASFGVRPTLSFMVGFPWNPEKDTENTLALISEVRAVCPQAEILLFAFSPYLGTPLYETAQAYGMRFPQSLEGWASFTYDKIQTPWISEKLRRKINRSLAFFGTRRLSPGMENFVGGMRQNAVKS